MNEATVQTNRTKLSKPRNKFNQPLSTESVSTFTNNYTTEQYFDEIGDWLNNHYGTNCNWHKFEDVISEGLDKMSDFYQVDMHQLSKYGKK